MATKTWEAVIVGANEVEIRTLMQGLEPTALKEFTALFLEHVKARVRKADEMLPGVGSNAPAKGKAAAVAPKK